MDDPEEDDERPSLGRLLAFSDAVFAIAFTILVLDLDVPAGLTGPQLHAALLGQVPHLVSALLGFAVIGRFWIAHHQLVDGVHHADTPLLALNVVTMAPIALVPYGASLVAEHPDDAAAVALYAGIVGAAGVAQLGLWLWAARERRLLHERVDENAVLAETLGLAGAAVALLLAVPVAFVSTVAAELCWLLALVPVGPLVSRVRGHRR